MSEWTTDTIKELLEARFKALEELRKQEAEALKNQAVEYERRLVSLNHEAQRLQSAVVQNVSRDTWEAFIKTFGEWKWTVDKGLNEATGSRTGVGQLGSTIYSGLMTIIAIAALAIAYLRP